MSDPANRKSTDPSSLPTPAESEPTSIHFLPHDVMQAIRDPGDWQKRTNALETLKGILEEVTDISALLSNFNSFISFLVSLLDDSHFRVIHTALQIIEMLAERFSDKIERNIIESTDSILQKITENKNSLYAREKMPKFFMKLMSLLTPRYLMQRLVTSCLRSRSHKVREDALFIIIAGLLTFPRTEFELSSVAEHVVPLVADSKQRVRYVALEAIAVVAHALEPGLLQDTRNNYMEPLLAPVQRWEEENMSPGILLKIIQARLARKKLPHINPDGTVEPAVPFPTNATRQDTGMDMEWVWSNTIDRTPGEEGNTSTNGTKLLPVPPPRRYSAGKPKLPWERERKEQSLSAPTKKDRQGGDRQHRPPPPTYANWLADPTGGKNLSRSDRFNPRTMDASDSPTSQPRSSYMDQYLTNKKKSSATIMKNRVEFYPGERDTEFNNDDSYSSELDLSQSWPAQHFESALPITNADSGSLYANNSPSSQFPFKLAKARPCSKSQHNHNPQKRNNEAVAPPMKASLHLPAIEGDPSERASDTSQIPSEIDKPPKKRDRRSFSSKPKRVEREPVSDDLSKVASSCNIGHSNKDKNTVNSSDTGSAETEIPPHVPSRAKRPLGADKPLTKAKLRSNTLPIPVPISTKPAAVHSTEPSDEGVSGAVRVEIELEKRTKKGKIVQDSDTITEIAPSIPVTRTCTPEHSDPPPPPVRGNQVAHPSEEDPKLVVKPPKAKPVRVSSKTRMRRTFIGPMSTLLTDSVDTGDHTDGVLTVDKSSTSLQDYILGLPQKRERSSSLPRLPSDTPSPHPQEIGDGSYEEGEPTPTPGDPITPISPIKPSPELEETIREEIDCSILSNANANDSISANIITNARNEGEMDKYSDFSPAQKQHNPSLKPPIPVRSQPQPQQQQKGTGYFNLYHKKKTYQGEQGNQSPVHSDSGSCSNLSKKLEVGSILPNKLDPKKRQSYENVPLSTSGRTARRRVDLTRSLNHTLDDELEDLSVFNDTSESVFSLSPSLGALRYSASSRVMDTSALSQLSLSPQDSKKHYSPLLNNTAQSPPKSDLDTHRISTHKTNNTSPLHTSPYEISGVTPMDCSPREKIARSPSYSPSNTANEATRVYTKGFSPSKAVKLAAKRSPVHSKPVLPSNDSGVGQKGVIGIVGISPSSLYSPPKQSNMPASPSRSRHPPPLKDIKPALETIQLEEGASDPLSHPESSLKDALCYLEDEDWQCQIEGLMLIKRLARYHIDTLLPQLQQIATALIAAVKNLRSSVPKTAISAFSDLFVHLNRMLEPYLELIVKALLHKAGESNLFIRGDVEKSLSIMIHNITPCKAFTALICGGMGHKNPVVRKLTMQLIYSGVERCGEIQVLSLPRDVLEKLMVSITNTSQDNSPDARYYARKAITVMIENPDFDRKLSKSLNPNLVSKIQDLVKLVQTKGVGDLSSAGIPSARQSRVSQPPTRQSQHSSETRVDSTGSVKNSYTLRQGGKASGGNVQKTRKSSFTHTQESLTSSVIPDDLPTNLESKNWNERLEAIRQFHEIITQYSSNISNDQRIVKVIESYILRLTDSNSKVNITAIECFLDVISVLGNKLVQHLHPVFKALTSNLASKNHIIKTKAKESLDTIIDSIDNSYLVQPLASVAQYANNLVRPVLLDSLAVVSDALFEKKPGVVQKYVLPLIFSLLEHHLNAECSTSLQNLCRVVYRYMNKSLFEKASRLSTSQQEKLRRLAS